MSLSDQKESVPGGLGQKNRARYPSGAAETLATLSYQYVAGRANLVLLLQKAKKTSVEALIPIRVDNHALFFAD